MRKKIGLITFVSLLGLVVLARDALVTKAAEIYVSRKMTSQGWSFSSLEREKNTLHINKLAYTNPSGGTFVEEASVTFHLSIIPLQLQPTVTVSHMVIEASKEGSSDDSLVGLLFCLGDSKLDLKLSIDEGEVRGVLEKPFAFSFKPGIEKREVGTLSIQDLEKHEFLQAHLKWEGESLVSQVEIEKGKASDLILLASFMQSSALSGWNQGQGEVSASVKSRFHPKKGLEELEGNLNLEDISFSQQALGLQLLSKTLKGTLFFSPDKVAEKNFSFWKRVELFLTFEDTSFSVDQKDLQLGVQEVLGEMRLAPEADPYLKMGGKIFSKNQFIPFEIEGKGQILEKSAFWMQTEANFFLPKNAPHLFVSYSQNEQKEGTLQADCKEMSQEVFNILGLATSTLHLPECIMLAGTFEGKFVGSFKGRSAKTLTFSECKSEGLALSVPSQNLFLNSDAISFSGTLERSAQGVLDLNVLDSEMKLVDLSIQNKEIFKSLSADLKIREGSLISSHMTGLYEGIEVSANILEPSDTAVAHIECKALSKDLMQKIWKEQAPQGPATPITLSIDVSNLEGKSHGAAIVHLTSSSGVQESIDLQISLNKEISRNVRDVFAPWDFSSLRGFFQTSRLSSETSSLWIRPWLGAFTLDGFLMGEGEFDRKKLLVDVSHADFKLSDGSWDVNAKLGTELQKVHVTYEYKEGQWKGTVPVDLLYVQNSKLQLEAKVQNSVLFFEGDQLWTDHFEAESFETKLLGSLLVDKHGVHVASKAFEGDLASLTAISARYGSNLASFGLKGGFAVEEHGCLVDAKKQGDQWTWDWKASIQLKELACDLGKMGKVRYGKGRLDGNKAGDFNFKDVQGLYSLAETSCPFALSDIHWSATSASPIDFSLLAKDGKREWMYVQGKAEKKKGGVVISLSPHSHILGVVMDVAPFMINEKFACSPLKISSSMKLEQLPSYFTMWKEMGLSIPQISFLDGSKGTLELQAMYDLQKSAWKAGFKSSEIATKQTVLGKASGVIFGDGKQVKIESCQIGPWTMKGALDLSPNEWSFSAFSVEWLDGSCLIKGKYIPTTGKLQIPAFSASLLSKELGTVQVQGSFEGSYLQESSSLQGKGSTRLSAGFPGSYSIGIETSKEIPFVFDSKRGVQIEKSQWELTSLAQSKQKLGKLSTKTITYLMGEKRLTALGVSLTLPKDSYKVFQNLPPFVDALKAVQINQEIELGADLDLSLKQKKITATLNNGSYKIQGFPLDLKQTKIQLDQENLYVSCQTKCQDEPLWLQLQMKLGVNPTACLVVKDNPELKGMAFQFKKTLKEGWGCEAVSGAFKGIILQVEKAGSAYDVQMTADLSQIPSLLPKVWSTNMKKWGLGQGYSFQGTLALNPNRPFQVQSLKGDLIGDGFEFLGKSFRMLTAKVDFTATKGRIHSIKIEDDLADLSIKTVDLTLNPTIKSWDISAPLIYVKDFAPALFIKGRKERGVEIKNLSIYDVKGALNNLDSFEGKGALFFSSVEKKEFSFWDVPLNLMKDWGLDPGLLTPVIGEADFVLRRGCFYFTAVRNVFSEGKRSQFYLAELGEDSYLSLDGSWHVDLAMKQNVVWKVTEDLVLSIRGTVDKPKYSFKSSKKSR